MGDFFKMSACFRISFSVLNAQKGNAAGDLITRLTSLQELSCFSHIIKNELHVLCFIPRCCVIPVSDEENTPTYSLSPFFSFFLLENDTPQKGKGFVVERG